MTGNVTISVAAPLLRGPAELVFSDAGNADTIARSQGSWVLDGFEVGQSIRVSGSADDDGVYTIAAIEDALLTLSAGDSLSPSAAPEAGVAVSVQVISTSTLPRLFLQDDVDVYTFSVDVALPTAGEGLKGATLRLIRGSGVGQEMQILSNTESTITVRKAFRGDITADTRFEIRRYDKLAVPVVPVRIEDDERGSVILQESGEGTTVFEGAPFTSLGFAIDTYEVFLSTAPDSDVTVTLDEITSPGTPDQLRFAPITLLRGAPTLSFFTDGAPQIVRDDAGSGGSFLLDGFAPGQVVVVAGSTANDGTYGVAAVTADTLTLAPGSVLTDGDDTAQLFVLPDFQNTLPEITFTADDWFRPRTIAVVAIDDAVREGFHTGFITHTVSGGGTAYQVPVPGAAPRPIDADRLAVDIGDDEIPGVLVEESGGSTDVSENDVRDGTGDSYTVVLTRQPDEDVFVTLSPQGTRTTRGDVIVHPQNAFAAISGNASLRFENGDAIVRSDGDWLADGFRVGDTVTVLGTGSNDTAAGATYEIAGLSDDGRRLTIVGDGLVDEGPVAGVQVTGTTFRANVQVSLETDAAGATPGADGSLVLRFTPLDWATPQVVRVQAVDDHQIDGGDTKEFAPIANIINKIKGPLRIEGEGGSGSTAGLDLDPLRLPGETNLKDSTGAVLALEDPADPSRVLDPSRTLRVDAAALAALGPEALSTATLEITRGREGEAIGQVRLVTAFEELGDGSVLLFVDEAWAFVPDVGADPSLEYAVSMTNPNLLVDEATRIDLLLVFNQESVADDRGRMDRTYEFTGEGRLAEVYRIQGLGTGPDLVQRGTVISGGISTLDLENTTVYLGSGDDTLQVEATQTRRDDPTTEEDERFRAVTLVYTGLGNDDVTVNLAAGGETVASGAVTSSSLRTLLDAAAPFDTDGTGLAGFLVRVTTPSTDGGDPLVQTRVIGTNSEDELRVTAPWDVLPDATSRYEIIRQGDGFFSLDVGGVVTRPGVERDDDRVDATGSGASPGRLRRRRRRHAARRQRRRHPVRRPRAGGLLRRERSPGDAPGISARRPAGNRGCRIDGHDPGGGRDHRRSRRAARGRRRPGRPRGAHHGGHGLPADAHHRLQHRRGHHGDRAVGRDPRRQQPVPRHRGSLEPDRRRRPRRALRPQPRARPGGHAAGRRDRGRPRGRPRDRRAGRATPSTPRRRGARGKEIVIGDDARLTFGGHETFAPGEESSTLGFSFGGRSPSARVEGVVGAPGRRGGRLDRRHRRRAGRVRRPGLRGRPLRRRSSRLGGASCGGGSTWTAAARKPASACRRTSTPARRPATTGASSRAISRATPARLWGWTSRVSRPGTTATTSMCISTRPTPARVPAPPSRA